MNAIPPSMTPPTPLGVRSLAPFGQASGDGSTLKWAALHDAASLIADLAGLEPGRTTREVRDFPALIRDAAPWRRELAERGIDDMVAVMEPAIAALLGVGERGADPRAAATALWREFSQARAAVVALLPPTGEPESRREA